jgi:hypothetical protein
MFFFLHRFIEAEHLVKNLHLSREIQDNSTPNKSITPKEIFSINERLYMNFTETCPLFLLKEGIDHRFEFLDFAPDLYIRQRFHPNQFIFNHSEIEINENLE